MWTTDVAAVRVACRGVDRLWASGSPLRVGCGQQIRNTQGHHRNDGGFPQGGAPRPQLSTTRCGQDRPWGVSLRFVHIGAVEKGAVCPPQSYPQMWRSGHRPHGDNITGWSRCAHSCGRHCGWVSPVVQVARGRGPGPAPGASRRERPQRASARAVRRPHS